jgi:hypothetical protein
MGFAAGSPVKKITFDRVEGYTLIRFQGLKSTNHVVITSTKHWQQWFKVDVPKNASLLEFQKNMVFVIVKYDNNEWQLKPRWISDMNNQWEIAYSGRIIGKPSPNKKVSILAMMVKKTPFPKLVFVENGLFIKEIRGNKK